MAHPLENVGMFRGLDLGELAVLWEDASEEAFADGALILREGSEGDRVYAILSGRADIEMSLPARSTSEIIATLKPGEVFGETTLFGKERRSASVRARGDARTLSWNAGRLRESMERNQATGYVILRNLTAILSDRLSATSLALRNQLTQSGNGSY